MKLNFILTLLLAMTFNADLAAGSVSTLAQRQEAITESFKKAPEEAVKAINEAQGDKLKVDDNSYIVVIEKDGDSYKRVAHFKPEKLKPENQLVEQSLMNIMREAETKLSGGSGPVAFSFSASDKKMYAIVSRYEKLLVFNICQTQEEVDSVLKSTTIVEEKKPDEITTPSETTTIKVEPAASDSSKH